MNNVLILFWEGVEHRRELRRVQMKQCDDDIGGGLEKSDNRFYPSSNARLVPCELPPTLVRSSSAQSCEGTDGRQPC